MKDYQLFLKENIDLTYRAFSMRLLPGVKNVLGVRIPILNRYSNSIALSKIDEIGKESFESIMIRGFLITRMDVKDIGRLAYVDEFVMELDNWSHCDSFCKRLKGIEFDVLLDYMYRNHEFSQRFALVMFLEHHINDEDIDLVISSIEHLQSRGYYSDMALAWLMSRAYMTYPHKVETWLAYSTQEYRLINLTLKKIRESRKLDFNTKKRLMIYKR